MSSAFSGEKKTIETFFFSQLTDPDRLLGSADGVIFAFGDVDRGIRTARRSRQSRTSFSTACFKTKTTSLQSL